MKQIQEKKIKMFLDLSKRTFNILTINPDELIQRETQSLEANIGTQRCQSCANWCGLLLRSKHVCITLNLNLQQTFNPSEWSDFHHTTHSMDLD